VSGREQLRDPVVDDLVADGRADASRPGEARWVDDRPVLGDANERRAEPSRREDLVCRSEREEVVEPLPELSASGEQRRGRPDLVGEAGRRDRNQSSESRAAP